MIDIETIQSFYPQNLRVFKKNLLTEYLQYKILEAIFDAPLGQKLCFMGGTAIHIIHQNARFSEDLDFDNMGLQKKDFQQLIGIIDRKLSLEGYRTDIKNVFKNAYRCYLRIADVLFEYGISKHKEEKLLIQIDTEPQQFEYNPQRVILNKFDVFLQINTVPADILLAQKIFSIFNRRRPMGRDFYAAVYLFGRTKANFEYLDSKLKIKDMPDLKEKLLLKCKGLDFRRLAKDAEPFLFVREDVKKILFFREYLESLNAG